MASISKEISAVDRALDRLRSIKFQITPEEHQLLGITQEDVTALTDPQFLLTPPEIEQSIQEIVTRAYHEVPAFKKLVTEDQRRDPRRFTETSRLVSKFLKHMRGTLPPESVGAIQSDTFSQAHDMLETALRSEIPSTSAPVSAPQPVPPLEPLKDEDLKLFELSRSQLTPAIQHDAILPHIQFFLGRLKKNGVTVPNKATRKMPDERRASYLFRLLREIRDIKITKNKTLKPFEVRWLGRDLSELQRIVDSQVRAVHAAPKEKITRGESYESVLQTIAATLMPVKRLSETLKKPELRESLVKISDIIDSALPTASLIEDRLKAIQDAAGQLGLKKSQLSMLLRTDPDTLAHTPEVSPGIISIVRGRLEETERAIADEDDEDKKSDLVERRQALERQLGVLRGVEGLDTTRLFGAVSDYLETLRSYADSIEKNLSRSTQDSIPGFNDILGDLKDIRDHFRELSKQDWFVRKWKEQRGILHRGQPDVSGTVPTESPAVVEPAVEKTASPATESYAKKLERFRGGGVRRALDEILSFVDDPEGGLEYLRDRLLSITKAPPGQVLEYDKEKGERVVTSPGSEINPTPTDYAVSPPEGAERVTLGDMQKKIDKVYGYVKNLDLTEKKEDAQKILQELADIPSHITSSVTEKKASVSEYLRRMASVLLSGASAPAPGPASGFKPGISPKPGKYRSPSKAGWFLYRERLTRMGKKALEGFFKDTPIVADFVEDMELAGLNDRFLKGAEVKAVDIDPILERVVQKASGKDDSLDNILGSRVAQQARSIGDIKKKTAEMEEAAGRVDTLNKKISALGEKYLPVLDKYAKFLSDPLGSARRQIEERRGPQRAPETTHTPKAPRIEPKKPVDVSRSNYQLVLKSMLDRYPRGTHTKTAAEALSIPTDEYRRVHGVTLRLQDMKKAVDAETDPKKRARLVKEYLQTSLDTVKRAQDYLNGYRGVLEADRVTIDNLKAYMGSEEGKRIPGREEALSQLKTLQDNFEHESRIFSYMTDSVRRAEERVPKATEYLKKVTEDLTDDEVKQLYTVAMAPEMEPSKEEAREIKERAKEHEKGIGFIIDRDTYKQNMNRIMTRHTERGPVFQKEFGQGGTKILPSDRVEEYKKLVSEAEARRADIEKIADEDSRLIQERHFCKHAVDLFSKMRAESPSIEAAKELIEKLKYIQQNFLHLEHRSSDMPPDEVAKERQALSLELKKYDIDDESELDKAIEVEERSVDQYRNMMEHLEKDVPAYQQRLKEVEQQMTRGKAIVPSTPQKLRERLMQLKVERMDIMSKSQIPMDQRTKRRGEIDKEIAEISAKLGEPIEDIDYSSFEPQHPYRPATPAPAPMTKEIHKEGAIEDTEEPLTEFERALEERGTKPALYTKELPKPKGWDVVENFFDESRRELAYLESVKKKGKDWDEALSKQYAEWIEELEKVIPAIDAYRNQIVQIGPEAVPLRDIVVRFEDKILEYQELFSKYMGQREAAQDRWERLQQDVDLLKSMYDEETGEYKGLEKEEIDNIRNIFFRMLYKYMDSYWSTKVGKNINVFGERDTEWYNNVYRTFKNLSQARSNNKLMTLLNKYKEVTQSEFPKDMSIRLNRIQALEDKAVSFYRGLKDQGVDPDRSAEYKELVTRIENLKAQKNQIDTVFNNMAGTVMVDIHNKVERELKDKITEGKPTSTVDLGKKADQNVDKITGVLEAVVTDAVDSREALQQAEQMAQSLERTITPGQSRVAYDRSHPDFDLKILYGSVMQRTIASMLKL